MINIVAVSPEFVRDIKPLAKKYHTIKQSVDDLQKALVVIFAIAATASNDTCCLKFSTR